MEVAFTILEENAAIQYTKKYTRSYLIEGFSQNKIAQWQWFGFSTAKGLGNLMNSIIVNKMNKPNKGAWFQHFIDITGYKWCSSCKTVKEKDEFYQSKNSTDGFTYYCISCCTKKVLKYRKNNPEKIKERSKEYRKNNIGKIRANDAKRRASLLQRTPKWITKKELKSLQKFYIKRPEGYHVVHIIPLQGRNVC